MSDPMTTNPLASNQWHLDLLGDIETIWADYTGEGVVVAVYDDGMDTDHEDLVDNYDESLELSFPDGDFNGSGDGHGTAVGGLIGAANNDIGGVGVAYDVTLVSVDFLNDAGSNSAYSSAVNGMANFDIINQSYGYTPNFNPALSFAESGTFGAFDYDLSYEAASTGRDGLGTIMVKAVGNDSNNPNAQAVGIFGNAQGDATNNWHFVIGVGALNPDGSVASYSNYGANLLVSAGAGSVTTDLAGGAGYDASDYTNTFGGTSAATPVTAGVIALMLEANPDLTLPEVQMILAISASMTGSDYGDSASGFEAGEWRTIGDGTWNGGGLTYNVSYGYGAVDVHAAVRMAEVWSLFSDGRTLETQLRETVSDTTNYVISDLSTTDIVLDVTDGVVIDHVYVTIDIQHTYISDLTIELIAPDGTAFELMSGDGGGAEIDYAWTFSVAGFRGIESEGTWTVRIMDDALGDTGVVNDVELEFIGAQERDNDVWHFTDDFLELAQVDAGRRLIGGEASESTEETINMVAVTGDVIVDLGIDGAIRVDREFWARQETDAIHNVLTGDGNDRINGRDSDEAIVSGRGNDLLFGGGGNDILLGEQGNDVIFGDENGGYGTEASGQVYRMYSAIFDRTPDTGGHQVWMNRLLTGELSIDEVAAEFIQSQEFINTYGSTTNSDFVLLLYQNVLGRDPDERGFNGWVNNLNNGMSRSEVVRRFSESQEHINSTAAGLETYENDSDASVYTGRLFRLYEGIFGRAPDEAGFEGWMNNFANGMTFAEVAGAFMASPEFQLLYSDTTDADFVELLYQNVLGRDPDEGGERGWLNNLANGMPRETVVEFFIESQEFINTTTADLIAFITAMGDDDAIIAGAGNNIVAGGRDADTFIFDIESQGTTTILDFELWDTIVVDLEITNDLDSALSQQGDDVVFSANGVEFILMDTDLDDIGEDQIISGVIDL
ncbi:DUF4214 domain-containing protein [Pseudooctadecabacter jejudonensis]|uniref:Calcium-dependent protease n=1 Tax=Pseudooctadecabacter jejudonensis TaxID=1391910 RepID=A0A1Y5TE56_9RHOB|nr:DUF4214 domain-containing protein [Pseudooctadecabacter jejudonensis]SLN61985.1 Calcium-dependent protease precursor [Pseudooctadecabacter jejudonensis]